MGMSVRKTLTCRGTVASTMLGTGYSAPIVVNCIMLPAVRRVSTGCSPLPARSTTAPADSATRNVPVASSRPAPVAPGCAQVGTMARDPRNTKRLELNMSTTVSPWYTVTVPSPGYTCSEKDRASCWLLVWACAVLSSLTTPVDRVRTGSSASGWYKVVSAEAEQWQTGNCPAGRLSMKPELLKAKDCAASVDAATSTPLVQSMCPDAQDVPSTKVNALPPHVPAAWCRAIRSSKGDMKDLPDTTRVAGWRSKGVRAEAEVRPAMALNLWPVNAPEAELWSSTRAAIFSVAAVRLAIWTYGPSAVSPKHT
mmetsp:Transcript_86124/g.196507  ORF Transcript_86124/g.196507 Transcript_86124/m.196507 type:complete len:310 (-) Transcript_86124:1584-2513(-)